MFKFGWKKNPIKGGGSRVGIALESDGFTLCHVVEEEGGPCTFSCVAPCWLTCASTTHVEGPTARSTLQIQSTAAYGSFGNRDFVSRTLNVTVVP